MKDKKGDQRSRKEREEQAVPGTAQNAAEENAETAEQDMGAAGAADTAPQSAQERIAELETELAELKDQYLRKAAEFDNYRKRMIKEKQDAFDYANTSLLADLLDSLDNFDRALEADTTDAAAIKQGVEMTKTQLVNMLESKYNLTGYGHKGDVFDPNIHEAIGSMQGAVSVPTCTEVYLKGYKLKDRVIRHAKVMVTMPDAAAQGAEQPDGGASEETQEN